MISFDEALTRVSEVAAPLGREDVPIARAHRRTLAAPVIARTAAPPADVSAMDGYAVRSEDLHLLPARLRLVGESFAGQGHDGSVRAGECVRIFTGAPVPPGADRVVMQEVVERDGGTAVFTRTPGSATHIRKAGSDFQQGDVVLAVGTLLGPRGLVAAAAADEARLSVYRRPRVTVLATGDELAEPGTAAGQAGRIPESVSFGVAALAEEAGAVSSGTMRLTDDLATMKRAVAPALDGTDLLVVTGGASVGERDFAKAMFEDDGLELIFSKVAMKPGKPVWLGRSRGKLVMGLPGNPTSALVTARLLMVPLLHGLGGRDPRRALAWRKMPLLEALEGAGSRETFSRAREEKGCVKLFSHQDSSAQKVLAEASLLVRRPAGEQSLAAGADVDALDL